MKAKINKFTSFCTAKKTNNKVKSQSTEWEKILATVKTNKELLSKTYKQLIQLNIKKKKQLKKGRRLEYPFLQRRYIDDQQAHEKMLNTANQGNANQNHKELSPHTCQNGYHQKDHKNQMVVRMWRKRNPCALWVGV